MNAERAPGAAATETARTRAEERAARAPRPRPHGPDATEKTANGGGEEADAPGAKRAAAAKEATRGSTPEGQHPTATPNPAATTEETSRPTTAPAPGQRREPEKPTQEPRSNGTPDGETAADGETNREETEATTAHPQNPEQGPPPTTERKKPQPQLQYTTKRRQKQAPNAKPDTKRGGTAASPEAEPGTPRDARRGGPRRPHPASECRGGERNRPYYKTGVRGVPGCGRHAASRSRFKVTRCFLVSVLGLAARAVATPATPGSLYRCGSPNRGLG